MSMKSVFTAAVMLTTVGAANAADISFDYTGIMNQHKYYKDSLKGNDSYNPNATKNFAVEFKLQYDDAVFNYVRTCSDMREFGSEPLIKDFINWFGQEAYARKQLSEFNPRAIAVINDVLDKVNNAYLDCNLTS